jgi:hypothetical protein
MRNASSFEDLRGTEGSGEGLSTTTMHSTRKPILVRHKKGRSHSAFDERGKKFRVIDLDGDCNIFDPERHSSTMGSIDKSILLLSVLFEDDVRFIYHPRKLSSFISKPSLSQFIVLPQLFRRAITILTGFNIFHFEEAFQRNITLNSFPSFSNQSGSLDSVRESHRKSYARPRRLNYPE